MLICVTICIGIGVVARLKYERDGGITLSMDVGDDQGVGASVLLRTGGIDLEIVEPREKRPQGSALGINRDLGGEERPQEW